jgi:hypothetical protein
VSVAAVKDKTLRDVMSAQEFLNDKTKINSKDGVYFFEDVKFNTSNNKILVKDDSVILYNRLSYDEDISKYTFEKLNYPLTPELKYVLGLSTKDELKESLKNNCVVPVN